MNEVKMLNAPCRVLGFPFSFKYLVKRDIKRCMKVVKKVASYLFLCSFLFVSYQGWYSNRLYITGWEVVEYNKPIIDAKQLHEITELLKKEKPEFDTIIILNWKRMEGDDFVNSFWNFWSYWNPEEKE